MTQGNHPPELGKWQLDRRVPVAVLLAIGVYAVAHIVFLVTMDGRITALENNAQKVEVRLEKIENSTSNLAVIQFQVQQMTATTARMEAKLETLSERQNGISPR